MSWGNLKSGGILNSPSGNSNWSLHWENLKFELPLEEFIFHLEKNEIAIYPGEFEIPQDKRTNL